MCLDTQHAIGRCYVNTWECGGLSEEEADAWDIMDSMPVGGLSDWEEPQLRSAWTLADVPGLTGTTCDDAQTGLRCTFQSEIH